MHSNKKRGYNIHRCTRQFGFDQALPGKFETPENPFSLKEENYDPFEEENGNVLKKLGKVGRQGIKLVEIPGQTALKNFLVHRWKMKLHFLKRPKKRLWRSKKKKTLSKLSDEQEEGEVSSGEEFYEQNDPFAGIIYKKKEELKIP